TTLLLAALLAGLVAADRLPAAGLALLAGGHRGHRRHAGGQDRQGQQRTEDASPHPSPHRKGMESTEFVRDKTAPSNHFSPVRYRLSSGFHHYPGQACGAAAGRRRGRVAFWPRAPKVVESSQTPEVVSCIHPLRPSPA